MKRMVIMIKICMILLLHSSNLAFAIGGGKIIPRKDMPVAQFFYGTSYECFAISGILIATTKVLTMVNIFNVEVRHPF